MNKREMELERHQKILDIHAKLELILKKLDEIEEKCACQGAKNKGAKK